MTSKPILAILIAALVAAYGAAGSLYLVNAQEQAAEITTAGEAAPASEIEVSGSGFAADSDASIYFMSSARADLESGSAFILQETNTNETGDQGNVVVALAEPANGTVRIECDDEDIGEGELDNANLITIAAPAGTYDECSISVSNGNATDAGEIGNLTIVPDPDEDYEDSLMASATADNEGSFTEPVTVPLVEEGDYAILAISDGVTAVAELAVTGQPAAETPGPNATGTVNQTMPVPAENATAQNQTAANQTGTTEASVQVEEENAEPGEPLPISGNGFEPNTPVQIFINNVQITNVITNVEGLFNTIVIVPTTVAAGEAEVVVNTEQTNVVKNVVIVEPDVQNRGPATVRFTSVSATDNAQALEGAPVTVFDTSTGELVKSDKTPFALELEGGTYSVFYSDFSNFDFQSAEPGSWTDTPGGGSGLVTVRDGRNATVTAMYSEEPAPPRPPRETNNSLILTSEDTAGEPITGMFVTVYDAATGEKIEQGFTELTVEDLPPGTYPVFFANFANLEFVSASPGSWVQTPSGGSGLVTIPDDGENHDITVTAVYERTTGAAQEQFDIRAPLDIRGSIFSITSNETRPEGPFVMSGSFALRVDDEDPLRASLSAYFTSVREDSNENVDLESQESRDHDTFQIVNLEPQVARPVGVDSYLISGTADLLLDGDVYSNDERVEVMVRGGEELTPTSVEIEFQGDHTYSAANRLETLFGAVTSGFR